MCRADIAWEALTEALGSVFALMVGEAGATAYVDDDVSVDSRAFTLGLVGAGADGRE